MPCHSGGLFKILWQGDYMNFMYSFKKHYHSSICSPLCQCSQPELILHLGNASISKIRVLCPSMNYFSFVDIFFSIWAPNSTSILYLRAEGGQWSHKPGCFVKILHFTLYTCAEIINIQFSFLINYV